MKFRTGMGNFGQQLEDQISEAFGEEFLDVTFGIGSDVLGVTKKGGAINVALREILDKIGIVSADYIADMFADPKSQAEVEKLRELHKTKNDFLNAYATLYINKITELVNSKEKIDTLASELGLDLKKDFSAQLRALNKNKKISQMDAGVVGNFLEQLIFDVSGANQSGRADPRGDLTDISLELKSQFGSGGSLTVGGITAYLPKSGKIADSMNKEQAEIMAKIMALYKMIIKMRNFLLVRYRFDEGIMSSKPKNFTVAIGASPKTIIFEEILLYMILNIAALWDEIEASYRRSQGEGMGGPQKILSMGTNKNFLSVEKNEVKITGSEEKKTYAYKMKFHLDLSLAQRETKLGIIGSGRGGYGGQPHRFGTEKSFYFGGTPIDQLYLDVSDLLQSSRGASVAFRAKLFGFIRHNKEWIGSEGV